MFLRISVLDLLLDPTDACLSKLSRFYSHLNVKNVFSFKTLHTCVVQGLWHMVCSTRLGLADTGYKHIWSGSCRRIVLNRGRAWAPCTLSAFKLWKTETSWERRPCLIRGTRSSLILAEIKGSRHPKKKKPTASVTLLKSVFQNWRGL